MSGTWDIIGYVVLALICLCKCCDLCGCACPDDPLAIHGLIIMTMEALLFLFFLILSPLWLLFYPFLDKNTDDDHPHYVRNMTMASVVEFYLYLLCLLLSPAWLPALWIEMCMEKYENETWPKFENDTTLLLNGYTRGVCWLYWVVLFIPVCLFALLIQLILLLITALLILMTCGKIELFDKANRKVQEVDITNQIDKLGRTTLLVLYILTGPIWFPFWICRSFCLSKADSDKEVLERDYNDTTAKNDDDLENGDAAATDRPHDIEDHNDSAHDDENVSVGVDHEDDEADQERGTGNVAKVVVKAMRGQDPPGRHWSRKKSRCEIDNGSANETVDC